MSTKNKGPGTGPFSDIPIVKPLANQVDVAGQDSLYQFQGTDVRTPTDSKALVQKIADTFVSTVFETGLTPAFIWMIKMWLQIVLMHLGMPSTLKMLSHTSNADTKLVPAIDSLLKAAPAIQDQDPRALKDVDLQAVAANQVLLGQVREILLMLTVAVHSVEAGETHLEQALDNVARQVFGKLRSLLSDDYQLGLELAPLTALNTDPVQQALETKKFKAKLTTDSSGSAEPPPAGPGTVEPSGGQGSPGASGGQGNPGASGGQGTVGQVQGGGTGSTGATATKTTPRKRKPAPKSPSPPKTKSKPKRGG